MRAYPLCEHDECVRARPRSLPELLARIYDCNTPRNADWTYLDGRVWRYACDAHQEDAAGAPLRVALSVVRDDPEAYWTPPPAYPGTNWAWAHELITKGVDL